MQSGSPRVLIVLPTYNERENLRTIVRRIRSAVPSADLLIADDASPDGTGDIADELAATDPCIIVEHRAAKLGLGVAYLEAFEWGLARGYDLFVEIDADGSHPPETLPEMIAMISTAPEVGLVIGSRWVRGGRVVNWPRRREVLSRGGNLYARLALGLPTHDVTGGFRVFNATALRAIALSDVTARGYFFQVEMTLRVHDAGFSIAEVPIEFREREYGESKMSGAIVQEAMLRVTALASARRFGWVTRVLGGLRGLMRCPRR